MSIQKNNTVFGHFEPEVSRQFLPGCRNCGGAHPLARKGQHDPNFCPDCGAPVLKPGQQYTDKAKWSFNPMILIARFMMWVGKTINKLSKRI